MTDPDFLDPSSAGRGARGEGERIENERSPKEAPSGNAAADPKLRGRLLRASPRELLVCMRPREWVKNLLLFAGLIFSQSMGNLWAVLASLGAFGLFCLAASAIYLLNDLVDMEEDRKHPVKKNRPLPSWRLDPVVAFFAMLVLAAVSLGGAVLLKRSFGAILFVYLAMNVAYSLKLKHVVILDVMLIAIGFVLRAVAGALVIGAPPSAWLVLCTLTLALLVGFGKRRAELSLLGDGAALHRASLDLYSREFLDSMMTISAGASVVMYALYALSAEIVQKYGTLGLGVTTPFVLFGVFRYFFLVHQKREGGDPSKSFVTDAPMVVNGFLWIATACFVIYGPRDWFVW